METESSASSSGQVMVRSSFSTAKEVFEELIVGQNLLSQPTNQEVARRHSISIINRTPPRNSVAHELLSPHLIKDQLQRVQSAMKDLKDLNDKLSDFGSCVSNQSSSSNEESEEDTTPNLNSNNFNGKRRRKRNKRKLKVTPVKEDFLKRPNLSTTN